MPIVPKMTPHYRATCDKCGDVFPEPALYIGAARKFAEGKGWKFDVDVVTCHHCLVLEKVKP